MSDTTQEHGKDLEIRLADARDLDAILSIFNEGLQAGTIPDNESGADLEYLERAYLSDEGDSGFWVAQLEDAIVRMIGVQVYDPDTAEIRRLRVRESHRRRGIGSRLLETAVAHCRERGLLKVSLDVLVDRKPAIELFEKTGFRLNRERQINDRTLLDFYIDLYQER